jgi:uncharacterized membrane protein HdeD (DUF308 family)
MAMMGTFERPRGGGREPGGASRWQVLIWSACIALVGVLLLFVPIATAAGIVTIVGVCWLVAGVISTIIALTGRESGWVWQLFGAVIGIVAGLVVLTHPLFSTLVAVEALFVILAVSILVVGGTEIIHSHSMGGAVLGVALVAIGLLMLVEPFHVMPLLTLIQWLGVICFVGGVLSGISAAVGRHPVVTA